MNCRSCKHLQKCKFCKICTLLQLGICYFKIDLNLDPVPNPEPDLITATNRKLRKILNQA